MKDPITQLRLGDIANRAACYRCHPGTETRCLRGAMGNAVAADGSMAMQCQSCHGGMREVGARARQGWLEQPTCQSCHTGTATSNNGQIRYPSVFEPGGTLRKAVNSTFATQPDTPAVGLSLYRFSRGHGGLQCEACHGSTHAEYPSGQASDNLQSLQLQGHIGVLVECTACHSSNPNTVTGGPHGLHPVGQSWISRHPDVVEHNGSSPCQACHGGDYRGTVLSRVQADRTLTAFGTKTFWRGFQVGCYNCHRGPQSDDVTRNRPAQVNHVSASMTSRIPVQLTLTASDPDSNPLQLRIISQPRYGTVALSNRTAIYRPASGFVGNDAFTFAAWDGSTDSNLGTGTVSVAQGPIDLSSRVLAPTTAEVGKPVPFWVIFAPDASAPAVELNWDFGDGSPHTNNQYSCHIYLKDGTYEWKTILSTLNTNLTHTGQIVVKGTGIPTPRLQIEKPDLNVVISWPAESPNFILEMTEQLHPTAHWSILPDQPVVVDGQNIVSNVVTGTSRYYRLRQR